MSARRSKKATGNRHPTARMTEVLEPRTLMAATPTLPAPTNVVVNAASDSQVVIQWADNSADESFFVVQRAKRRCPRARLLSATVV
jgi:hypothetical protein